MQPTIALPPDFPAPTRAQRDALDTIEKAGRVSDELAHEFIKLDASKEGEGEFANLYRLQRDDSRVWLPHTQVATLDEHGRATRVVVSRDLFAHILPMLGDVSAIGE